MQKHTAPSPLPIGELMVKEGLIPPEAVDKIVRKQEQNAATGRDHKLFGQLCVEMKLLPQWQVHDVLRKYRKRILLGELLVIRGLLTQSQLKQTLEIQKKYPKHRIGGILVELGAINDDQLAAALSQQLDIPLALPTPQSPALDKLGSLDSEFVRQNQFCPVSEDNAGLIVAMADPQNDVLHDYLTQTFSCKVIPAVASAAAIKSVIDKFYYRASAEAERAAVLARRQAEAAEQSEGETDEKLEFRVTMLGPLDLDIDVQRELDKAGKTHGLDFMDNEEYQGISPRRGKDPGPAGANPAFNLKQQKTLIERWPFLLMDKEQQEAERAKRPEGPSIDEILREKFGDDEGFSLTSTFILSRTQPGLQVPESIGKDVVDLKASMRYSSEIEAALRAAKAAASPAQTTGAQNGPQTGAQAGIPAGNQATPPAAPKPFAEPFVALNEDEDAPDTLIVGPYGLAQAASPYRQEEGMLNYLIKGALSDGATAIYLEPQDKYLRVRFRVDGVLQQKTALPQNLAAAMLGRLKLLCELDPGNSHTPQRHRVQASFNETELELSVATYPSVWGESLALSFRYKQDALSGPPLQIDSIGLSPLNLARLQGLLGRPGGLLLVTGPARAGKTTTLYAACHYLNVLSQLIVTAESPVERLLTGILQGNWTPGGGESFAEMIRSMGYMNPEVMMVSAFESPETVAAGIELALGGAKLMAAYQSFDTMGALQRLAGQGLDSFLVASGELALLSQRLVRQLCPHCKRELPASREGLDRLGLTAVQPEAFMLYGPRGCDACHHLGYSGQLAIHELLVLNESLRQALIEHRPAAALRELARGRLISMVEDGYAKAVEGLTSLAELQRVAFVNEYDSATPMPAEKIVALCRGEEKLA